MSRFNSTRVCSLIFVSLVAAVIAFASTGRGKLTVAKPNGPPSEWHLQAVTQWVLDSSEIGTVRVEIPYWWTGDHVPNHLIDRSIYPPGDADDFLRLIEYDASGNVVSDQFVFIIWREHQGKNQPWCFALIHDKSMDGSGYW